MYQTKENEEKDKENTYRNSVSLKATSDKQYTEKPATQSLQKSIGNQAVKNLYQSKVIQAKLKINEAEDEYEKEADEVANQVVQAGGLPGADERPVKNITPLVQAQSHKNSLPVLTGNLSKRIAALHCGRQLNKSERNFFEPRFDRDLSSVRLHTDYQAQNLASSINAKAFTYGNNIVFGANQFQPSTKSGKHLIAHELTHVFQQGGGRTTNIQRDPDDESELAEELIPTATYEIDLSGILFTTGPEAAFQAGLKTPQLLQIALKSIIADNKYSNDLVMPLYRILNSKKKQFLRTGHFTRNEEARKGEKIGSFGFSVEPLMIILVYLESKKLKVNFTEQQLQAWIKAYANRTLFSEFLLNTIDSGLKLPKWYTINFFNEQMRSRSKLLEEYKKRLVEFEDTGSEEAKFKRIESTFPIFSGLYSDIFFLDAIREDTQLYVNPETQLAYQAVWYLSDKKRDKNKPAVILRSMKNALQLLEFSNKHPVLKESARVYPEKRIEILKMFMNEVGLEDKSTINILPAYPSFIASPDLNPDHTTVTTATNTFRMLTKMKDVHGGNLLHQTTLAMAQDVYYSWKIFPLPDSLKFLHEKKNIPPDQMLEMSNEFVKNSSGNLKNPVKEYKTDRDYEQSIDMNDLSIGSFLLMGNAAPQYRKDLHWIQQPSMAGHPFFVHDIEALATTSAYAEADQLSKLKEQHEKAPDEEKPEIQKSIELLEKREGSNLLVLTKTDIEDTDKLLDASKKLKQFIIDSRTQNRPSQGSATTDPFIVRLQTIHPDLFDVYTMIRQNFDSRLYDDITAINKYIEILEQQKDQLSRLRKRVSHAHGVFKAGSPTYRVVAAIVKKDDGNAVPLMLVAGYHPEADPENGKHKIKIVDVTFDAPKKNDMIYVGDTANSEKEAVDKAFVNFGKDNKYGEGKIVYRLPQTSFKGTANSITTVLEYLEYAIAALGIILLVAGVVASGGALTPAAAAVVTALGVSLAVVGASLAVRNILKRKEKGTLELDSETAMDIISIIGAVVVVAGTVSRVTLAARSASLSRVLTLQRINRLIAVYDVTEVGVNAYLINAKVQEDVKAIKALNLPKEQEEQMIAAVAFQAVQQGAMLGVAAYTTFRQIPEVFQNKVTNTRYKSWEEKGWIKVKKKSGDKVEVQILDSAPPFLRRLKPKVGKAADKSQQGDVAKKAVIEETLEFTTTKDGDHRLTVTEQGRIIRCSDFCTDLRFKYHKILAQDPDLHQRLITIEAKSKKAADTGDKKLAKEALAEAKELEGTLSWADTQWKKFTGVTEEEIDQALDIDAMEPGKVIGGKKSGFKIGGRRIPKRKRRRLDVTDIMSEKEMATKGGFQVAIQRIGQVMGKKVSEVDVLKKHWETAVKSVLKGKKVTDYSKDVVNKKLYPAARRAFWKLVRNDKEAVALLKDAGFEFKSKRGAPLAVLGPAGKDKSRGKISKQERRVSLDHIEEKAQGENWKKALDADNLEFMFQNANSEKEIVQVRHKMRGTPPPPVSKLPTMVLTPNEQLVVTHGRAIGMLDIEIEQFLKIWDKNPDLSVENMIRQMDQLTQPLKENPRARARLAPDIIMDPETRKLLPDFEQQIAGTGGIQKITVKEDIYEGDFSVTIEGLILPGRLTRRKGQVTATRRRAPDFNRSSKLFTRKEAKLSRQWQRLHLWGPGFGDEAAAGMMWGPKEVNLRWQNEGIENYIRDLSALAEKSGGSLRLKATAVAWEDPTPSGWKAPQGEHFLKHAEYEITLQRPGQPDTTLRISIDVKEPPNPKLESFDITSVGINLGELL